MHDALYHGKHNPDLDAPDVERKFNNKGEKSKGDGVHRLRCARLEEGKGGTATAVPLSAKPSPLQRRIVWASMIFKIPPYVGMWRY